MRPISIGGAGGGYADYEYWRQAGTAVWECWYCGSDPESSTHATNALAANILYGVPFTSPRGGTLDRIGMYLAVNNAVGNLRIGIWQATSNTNLYPAGLLLDSGAISTNAIGLRASGAIATVLSPNTLYWLGCLTDTAVPWYNWIYGAIPYIGWGTASVTMHQHISVATAYGALPNPFTAGAVPQLSQAPAIGVRYSA
jgi:hypothetical protein